MVSIIKSLFISDTSNGELFNFLKKCSETIKQMNLGNLFMGLQIIKYKNHKMVVSSAGMPPINIYRAETNSVEEIVIKSMPLGGPSLNNYETKEIEINKGDVLLLMSDGYPELFNENDEMFGYLRAKEAFKDSALKSADAISLELTNIGKRWRGKRPQEDDITFVVMKVK